MDGFALAPRRWGLYVTVRRALSEAERDEFADLFQRACWFLRGRGAGWSIVADLCGVSLSPDLHERLAAPMHLARQHDAGRVAALVRGGEDAAVVAGALRAAGLAERARVLVAADPGPESLRCAHDWALKGAEPFGCGCTA
ncbi:hypothetical protein [Azospirillum sp. TSO22-1]|uniref:hypothetical protein n=1 Tax=Azospirillum sp. TSO22-1 TaxID=716789 RepID=UPI000D60977D|nr:hypothetical protein [Azospirillum sp. TSO22-1]PWC53089.1 hypothetical protein TSO221_11830 [Azospirillum sp. TSO22-1]